MPFMPAATPPVMKAVPPPLMVPTTAAASAAAATGCDASIATASETAGTRLRSFLIMSLFPPVITSESSTLRSDPPFTSCESGPGGETARWYEPMEDSQQFIAVVSRGAATAPHRRERQNANKPLPRIPRFHRRYPSTFVGHGRYLLRSK